MVRGMKLRLMWGRAQKTRGLSFPPPALCLHVCPWNVSGRVSVSVYRVSLYACVCLCRSIACLCMPVCHAFVHRMAHAYTCTNYTSRAPVHHRARGGGRRARAHGGHGGHGGATAARGYGYGSAGSVHANAKYAIWCPSAAAGPAAAAWRNGCSSCPYGCVSVDEPVFPRQSPRRPPAATTRAATDEEVNRKVISTLRALGVESGKRLMASRCIVSRAPSPPRWLGVLSFREGD
jgi:hypothetical protein